MIRKLLQPFYTAYVVVTFSISLILAFPFFVLISTGNNAASRKAIWFIIKIWSRGWLFFMGMPLLQKGSMPKDRRYVIVANHISYLDTVNIFAAVPTYFRPLGKIEMSSIPIFGFVYKQIVLMVDRSNAESRALSMRLMWRNLKHYGNVLIFPEGTFNESKEPLKYFYDGAFRLAINTQTPIVPIIFPDTVKRWHYSRWWKMWPGRNRAIYLPPVDVTGMRMEDVPKLKQKIYSIMENALKNIAKSDTGNSENFAKA